jgi:adenosylcobinamide-GDP ribazoletransferase
VPDVRSLLLALSWLTVVPVRLPDSALPGGRLDDRVAAGALRWAPAVGVLLGAAAGTALLGAAAAGVPAPVAGLLTVGFLALATRGMHLDGLADTADGLGCYGPPERAMAVMRDGGAGPFAVVTLVLVLGVQAGSFAALTADGGWQPVAAVAVAVAGGRAAFAWVARRGTVAARPGGLGATVAGSQPPWVAPAWWLVLAGAGWVLVGWRGPVAVAVGATLVVGLAAHTTRRFGGMSGDVLGGACELATTAALVVLATA